ncbi:MAG: DUF58 domain-containing protein [Nanohaloarchaea archaeon SW_4_43_9]|nr:MAG: DUF58 domain-containing protein [Nanohaloarchaea archaeon SW_4_43_9]
MIEINFIDELDRFNLALKKNSTEIKEGEQSSSSTGQGIIFEEHKKYLPGDDIRRIDWKVYARTDNLYVKRFEEEKSITVHILIDRSSSMNFGKKEKKYDYASKIGLAMAYMVANTNDRFRFSVFSETITDISSARKNPDMGGMVETLNQLRKTPESKVEKCLTEYSSRIKNKSVVVIISDFLTELGDIESGLNRLENSDVILVNTLDIEEIDPSIEGDKILQDPESDSELRTYVSRKTRSNYKQQLEEHMQKIEEKAEKYGAEYILASTQEDVFESFLKVWGALNE